MQTFSSLFVRKRLYAYAKLIFSLHASPTCEIFGIPLSKYLRNICHAHDLLHTKYPCSEGSGLRMALWWEFVRSTVITCRARRLHSSHCRLPVCRFGTVCIYILLGCKRLLCTISNVRCDIQDELPKWSSIPFALSICLHFFCVALLLLYVLFIVRRTQFFFFNCNDF